MCSHPFIPVAAPLLNGNEAKYVQECIETNWITTGSFVTRFEAQFAEFCGVKEAVAVCNGTVALHVALLALGIGPGDEVIVPTVTYIATANAVTYCGATAVFVDIEPRTWNIDPEKIRAAITPRTRAIIPVHLYGHPAAMTAIREIATQHELHIIEDAAEAHGARYRGTRVGALSEIATFSFYGNKIITTGEGGMITLNDKALADRCRLLRGQGMDPARRYVFPIVGYNYRMTNLSAAIGVAQMERIEEFIERKRRIAESYRERLRDCAALQLPVEEPWAESVYWIYTVIVKEANGITRDGVMRQLADAGIETRPMFYPLHTMPPYLDHPRGDTPVADDLALRGINLPSGCGLTQGEIDRVCTALLRILE